MIYSDKNLADFILELTPLVLTEQTSTAFRHKVLILIKKYFNIKMSSFILFNKNAESNLNYRESILDNITIGISQKSIEKYYKDFYNLVTLYDTKKNHSLLYETKEMFEGDRIIDSKLYRNFYEKDAEFYFVCLGIIQDDDVIGILTFLRNKDEKEFDEKDIRHLKKIRDYINYELKKALIYNQLKVENFTLKESDHYFPVAKIVLDHTFNVMYYNNVSIPYIKDITNDDDPVNFKYFVINNLLSDHYLDNYEDDVIYYGDYIFRILHPTGSITEDKLIETIYTIYFVKVDSKRMMSERQTLNLDALTDREYQVTQLIKQGLTNDEIAEKLYISPLTVKTHVQKIYAKLNITNRSELVFLLLKE